MYISTVEPRFNEGLACCRRSDSRARCSDGGERAKTYAALEKANEGPRDWVGLVISRLFSIYFTKTRAENIVPCVDVRYIEVSL